MNSSVSLGSALPGFRNDRQLIEAFRPDLRVSKQQFHNSGWLSSALPEIQSPLPAHMNATTQRVTRASSGDGQGLGQPAGEFARKLEHVFARCLADQLLSGSSLSATHKAVGLKNWNHLIAETFANAISTSGLLKLADRLDIHAAKAQEPRNRSAGPGV